LFEMARKMSNGNPVNDASVVNIMFEEVENIEEDKARSVCPPTKMETVTP